jgi:hypothetical protein
VISLGCSIKSCRKGFFKVKRQREKSRRNGNLVPFQKAKLKEKDCRENSPIVKLDRQLRTGSRPSLRPPSS